MREFVMNDNKIMILIVEISFIFILVLFSYLLTYIPYNNINIENSNPLNIFLVTNNTHTFNINRISMNSINVVTSYI